MTVSLPDGEFVEHTACIANHFPYKKPCKSSDAMGVYCHETEEGDEIYSASCFSCKQGFTHNQIASTHLKDVYGIEFVKSENVKEMNIVKKPDKPSITKEEYTSLKGRCCIDTTKTRGISGETYRYYKVLSEMSSEGECISQYYPITEDFKLKGYKKRKLPKDFSFGHLGRYGKYSDLFGMSSVPKQGKYLLITSGEIDAMSGHQILNGKKDGTYDPIAVVGGVVGEGTIVEQIKTCYSFLENFEIIVVAMDADEAGEEAAEKIIKVLPKGKGRVMTMPLGCKDPNDALIKGKEAQFIRSFYDAKVVVPDGIVASDNLENKMIEHLSIPRITLPPFMRKMQEMLCGGLPIGYIVNILAASGIGKSTFCDSMILHWIMHDPRKVGIVSLEASEGEYAINLSSAYCGFKVNLLAEVEDRLEYINKPENVAKRKELWQLPDGTPRFYLVDADVSTMQQKIEYLIKIVGCKIIVLDPLQDVLDMLSEEEQKRWIAWEKEVVKREKVNIININHARKSSNGQKANSKGADLSEEDMHGTSNIFKSGGINIILTRDKENEDPLEKNTTYAKITKARGVGNTGKAGAYYYDNETHTLWDREDFLEKHPEKIMG